MQNNCACLADCAYNSSDRSNKKTPVTDDITGVFYDEKIQTEVFYFCTALPGFFIFTNAREDLTPRRRRGCVVAYLSSASTLWGCWLAWASMAVAACWMIWVLARVVVATA